MLLLGAFALSNLKISEEQKNLLRKIVTYNEVKQKCHTTI